MLNSTNITEIWNPEFLRSLIKEKQWDRLAQILADSRVIDEFVSILSETDILNVLIDEMPKENILSIIQKLQFNYQPTINQIFTEMEKKCDDNPKLTDLAYDIIKSPIAYNGAVAQALNCCPTDVIAKVINARIPYSDFKHGMTLPEKLLYVFDGKHSYKDLQERDAYNMVTIPVNCKREKVVDTIFNCFQDTFQYVETLDWKSPLINASLDHISRLVSNSYSTWEPNAVLREKLGKIVSSFKIHKVFPTIAFSPVINGSGNRGINIINLHFISLENAGVIPTNFFYTVFKNSVEANNEDFIKLVTQNFLTNNAALRYLRDTKDGVFDKLFEATIERAVKDFLETGNSVQFERAAVNLFRYNCVGQETLTFDESVKFINEVCKRVLAKKSTVLTDSNTFPNICLRIVTILSSTTFSTENAIMEKTIGTPIELLEKDVRNSIVLGAIRHPTEETKFSQYITSNRNTALVGLICKFASVSDISLVLPEKKRGSLDKYSLMPGKAVTSPQSTKLSIVEIFLQQMKFWESTDQSFLQSGYQFYQLFVEKMLSESLKSDDQEFKKAALSCYERLIYLLIAAPNARNLAHRYERVIEIIPNPVAWHISSLVDDKLTTRVIENILPRIPNTYLARLLCNVLSRSHFEGYLLDAPGTAYAAAIMDLLKNKPISKNRRVNFFLSSTEVLEFAKRDWKDAQKQYLSTFNVPVIDVCNPLLTDHPVNIQYNAPQQHQDMPEDLLLSISQSAWFKVVESVNEYYKVYQPKDFESDLAQMYIQIRQFAIDVAPSTLMKHIELERPIPEIRDFYQQAMGQSVQLVYNKAYVPMIKEYFPDAILNFDAVKDLTVNEFLDEYSSRNHVPIEYDGFIFYIYFKPHPEYQNIFSVVDYRNQLRDYKSNALNNVNNANRALFDNVQAYRTSQLIGEKLKEEYNAERTTVKSEFKSYSQNKKPIQQFIKVFEALNKCKAADFYQSILCMESLENFYPLYNTMWTECPMITELADLVIKDMAAPRLTKSFGKKKVTYTDLINFFNNLSIIALYSFGTLQNFKLLAKLNENQVHERFSSNNDSFVRIVQGNNLENIIMAMNTYFYASQADQLLSLKPQMVYEVIKKLLAGSPVLDDYIVPLCKLSVNPQLIGFPAPAELVDFLKFAAKRNLQAKRAAVACASFYVQLHSQCGIQIPDVFEIYELAFKGYNDEMCAFFCLLCARTATEDAMRQIPALSDLLARDAMPNYFTPWSTVTIPKELGAFYEKVVDNFILSGLVSKLPQYVELATHVLGELNLGESLPSRIAPFIEKGLNELKAGEDNSAFLKFATSFTALHEEFKECFDSYSKAIKTLTLHSYVILKENARRKADQEYPKSFAKLGSNFNTIEQAIFKPFSEFKEPSEMAAVSKFCRKILPTFNENMPAVAVTEYMNLQTTVAYFAGQEVENYSLEQDKKKQLTSFIKSFAGDFDICTYLPDPIREIFNRLQSSFTSEHTIEVSKLPRKLQRATQLSGMLVRQVLDHMPELGDDELVKVIADLGIFARQEQPVIRPVMHTRAFRVGAAPMAAGFAAAPPPPPPSGDVPESVIIAPQMCCFAAAAPPMEMEEACLDAAPVMKCKKSFARDEMLERAKCDMLVEEEAPMEVMTLCGAPAPEANSAEEEEEMEDEEGVAVDALSVKNEEVNADEDAEDADPLDLWN